MSDLVNCGFCGEPFEPKRKGHRYCKAACRVAANRADKTDPTPPVGVLSLVQGGGGDDQPSSGRSRPVSADSLLAPAIAETLDALQLGAEDRAARRLVERYAATIDEARRVAEALDQVPVDEDNARFLYSLKAKVEAQTVLETLGPKLLAALDSLGATPKARAALKGGGARGGQPGRLAAFRTARED